VTTTIKVSDELRADAEDRRRRLESLRTAIARTPDAGAKSHAAETGDWERLDAPVGS
jgi:hypothetical protein